MRLVSKFLLLSILILALALPWPVLGQNLPQEPGQDPFAISPELLQLFQGYEGEDSANSLFNGDDMKYNGLFTANVQQLGGASPDLTAPVRDNEEEVKQGPTRIVITSKYGPSGDLTKDSKIVFTVTLKNIGDTIADNILFYACLQDDYITLLEEPAPEPPFTNDPMAEIEDAADEDVASGDVPIEPETPDAVVDPEGENPQSTTSGQIQDPTITDCFMRLEWDSIDGEPITLAPGEEVTFEWSFQPKKDDIVIRWRLVAEYGAGASYLRHWIPVKNPNPNGGAGMQGGGLSNTCSQNGQTEPYPAGSPASDIIAKYKSKWNIELTDEGSSWSDPTYEPFLKLYWETLSAVECTPFISDITGSEPLCLMAGNNPGLWGDFLTPPCLKLHLPSILPSLTSAPAHVAQNLIHELGHVWTGKYYDKYEDFAATVCGHGDPNPNVSGYGNLEGCSEDIAEMMGYYAIRESTEFGFGTPYCAVDNPFNWGQTIYYNWAKTNVFGGHEFGPPPPNPPTECGARGPVSA